MIVQAAAASGAAVQRVKKTLRFHTQTDGGTLVLHGLPTGRAKIVVTRVHDGVTSVGRRSVRVRPNTIRVARVRLRVVH